MVLCRDYGEISVNVNGSVSQPIAGSTIVCKQLCFVRKSRQEIPIFQLLHPKRMTA